MHLRTTNGSATGILPPKIRMNRIESYQKLLMSNPTATDTQYAMNRTPTKTSLDLTVPTKIVRSKKANSIIFNTSATSQSKILNNKIHQESEPDNLFTDPSHGSPYIRTDTDLMKLQK